MSIHGSVVALRYGEIGLKGGNRSDFEKRLRKNLAHALRGLPHDMIQRTHGRIFVRGPSDALAVAERSARIFGVTSSSPGLSVKSSEKNICEGALDVLENTLVRRGKPDGSGCSFRLTVKRVDKRFEPGSMELARRIADHLLVRYPALTVKMRDPDITVGVEVRADESIVFAERCQGPGGLPLGSLGRAIVLFSGGIDSPVAAWLAMKRGLEVELLHFHASPFVGDLSRVKAIDLARVLSRYAGRVHLRIIPFADVQVAIKQGSPPPFRTIMYRRSMNRIAAIHATECQAGTVVTGESLGQVASQTLENLQCIEDSADRIVLRPLITFDKGETVELARHIGTYDISIRPHPDCCTLFMPERPKIRADLEEVRKIDGAMDLVESEQAAWAARENVTVQEGEVIETTPVLRS